jgi:hypothetical protein
MASLQNLTLYQGEAAVFTFTLNPVVNLTGWAITFTVTPGLGNTTVLIQKTVGAGVTLTNPSGGTFTVQLASGDTNAADRVPGAGLFAYDLWRTNAGSETLLFTGMFFVLPEVRL